MAAQRCLAAYVAKRAHVELTALRSTVTGSYLVSLLELIFDQAQNQTKRKLVYILLQRQQDPLCFMQDREKRALRGVRPSQNSNFGV